jgi:DNA topoisomerase III
LCLDSLEQFEAKFAFFVANIASMDELFEVPINPIPAQNVSCYPLTTLTPDEPSPQASFDVRAAGGKPFVRCGLTRRYLELIETRPMRLYNPKTEAVYRLPQGGIVKVWKGDMCPVCKFELCLFVTGERSYPLCPHCISNHQEEWGDEVCGAPVSGTCMVSAVACMLLLFSHP